MINELRILEEFIQLTKIPGPGGRERQVADILKEKITALGLEVSEDSAGRQAGGNAGNLIFSLPPAGKASWPVLLCAHMDTVEPCFGVDPIVENGIVRSRGETILGADDKAGIAAILEVIKVILESKMEHGGLEIVFTIWEEGGLFGAKNLDVNRLNSRLAYVLDCDGPPGTIIIKAPTQDKIVARIKGRAAHAGINPEEGVNAIFVAASAIAKMKLGRIDAETTANIGVISGGRATNIIPDLVHLEGEARSLDNSKCDEQTRVMAGILEQTASGLGAQTEIKTERLYHGFKLSQEDKVIQLALAAAQKLDLAPKLVSSGGGSDANIFNHRSITCANLGIGMKKVHTTEEYIKVEDLVNSARFVLEIVKSAQGIQE